MFGQAGQVEHASIREVARADLQPAELLQIGQAGQIGIVEGVL